MNKKFKKIKTMKCIKTDSGNLFIKTTAGETEIFFFIDPNGNHLDNTMEYYTANFYKKALKTWGKKEQEVPLKNIPHVKKVVQKYLEQKKIEATYMKATPATNSIADFMSIKKNKKG